jgi:hypothetical protein
VNGLEGSHIGFVQNTESASLTPLLPHCRQPARHQRIHGPLGRRGRRRLWRPWGTWRRSTRGRRSGSRLCFSTGAAAGFHHLPRPADSCACHATLLASSWEWCRFHALLSKPPCRTSLLVLVCAEHGLLRQAGQYRGAASNRRQRERCSRQAAAGARVTIYTARSTAVHHAGNKAKSHDCVD